MTEFEIIDSIRRRAARRNPEDLILGIGDDAAILSERSGREMLLSVDLLVEEIDFKLAYAVPSWLGHKSLAVSLSDIAAMGGEPRFSLITLGIPRGDRISPSFLEEFFKGYFALAEEHGVTLLGGDLSSTPDRLMIDSFAIGYSPAGEALRRNGARAGDSIYVTGRLGAAAAGLQLLLQGVRPNEPNEPNEPDEPDEIDEDEADEDEVEENTRSLEQSALRAHLRPEPRVAFGRRLAAAGLAHAMIDVSDGLAQDLAHLCRESGTGALIDYDSLPIAAEVSLIAQDRDAALSLALNGGEDFELLFTAAPAAAERLSETAGSCGLELSRIGEIIEGCGDVLLRSKGDLKPVSIRGYDHFRV
ncbi:MAG: thiamine-phosphate kinase [Blastocatellia bacterium]|nr:thiamine-phosphate kinase [Blastocatellia bacterium]